MIRLLPVIATLFILLTPQSQAAEGSEAEPMKIVALAPHIVELLYSIGAGDHIIATTDYADYPEAANGIPRVGSYAGLQVEKIIAMKPDIVIAWKTGNPVADVRRLEDFGLNVVYSDIVTLEDVATELQRLGRITGHIEEAQRQAEKYSRSLAGLRQQYQSLPPVTVFYELWSRPLTTVAGSAWPQQQLTLCGARNLFRNLSQDYPQVSIEQVVIADPDVIIQPDHNGKTDIDGIDWARWPQLRAVKAGMIIHPDADQAHRMTLRALDATRELCAAIARARPAATASASE